MIPLAFLATRLLNRCKEPPQERLSRSSPELPPSSEVQLNVGHCPHVSAFPGQIVGVVGQSGPTGTFHASHFLPGCLWASISDLVARSAGSTPAAGRIRIAACGGSLWAVTRLSSFQVAQLDVPNCCTYIRWQP